MYYLYYGEELLHDPMSEEYRVSDLRITFGINEVGEISFSIYKTNPLLDSLQIRSNSNCIYLYDDDLLIFDGFLYEITENFDGSYDVIGKSSLGYLSDTLVRPYSTDTSLDKRVDLLSAPQNPEALFRWYISQHNSHVFANYKEFKIGETSINELAKSLNSYYYCSNTSTPTTAEEINSQLIDIFGGYLFVNYDSDGNRYINYLADCTEVNTQMIDFGVNLLDFVKTNSSDGMYTAIRPEGATKEATDDDDDTEYGPITLFGYDPGSSKYTDFFLDGDVLYHEPSKKLYGMIEYAYSNSDISSQAYLYTSAVTQLKKLIAENVTMEVKAIDLRLLEKDKYKPLTPGEIVRVRSIPNDYDSYMFVSEVELNIDDPSQTTYTLGITYNTYTGIQNRKIKELNSSIDTAQTAVEEVSTVAASKRRVFTIEPVPPYEVGDLWVREVDGRTVVMVCTIAKEE
jgi:hypothetical protein